MMLQTFYGYQMYNTMRNERQRCELRTAGKRGGGEKWQLTGPGPMTMRHLVDPLAADWSLPTAIDPN